jgi:diaminopimelate decarboxylase
MNNALHYHAGILHIEDIPVSELAEQFGTPLYVYSTAVLRAQYDRLADAVAGMASEVTICYALKANGNPAIGGLLAGWGAGADVVSGGEIYLARRMGFLADKIVFAGVGKTRREMAEALREGVHAFHVESTGELTALEAVAEGMGKVTNVAVRVNPDVDAHTHPYITTGTHANKFGVAPQQALDLTRAAARSSHLRLTGLHVHIGSQLSSVQPIAEAVERVLELWDTLASEGIELRDLNIGGGLGIPYRPEDNPEGPEELAEALRPLLAGRDLHLFLEPGRFIVGPAGALLTTVLYVKEGQGQPPVIIVDAGMNDLIRPALYGAWHPVYPVNEAEAGTGPAVDIAGPVCESSDFMGHDRRLGALKPGDLLAIGQAGAYGFAMTSQYNGRPRPAEVLVSGEHATLIRRRETYEDLEADYS